MASFAAARSAMRAASASRLGAGAAKRRPSVSPFGIPKQTQTIRPCRARLAVETSRCLGSMLPYHTATATSLLNSMLSLSNPIYGWTSEGC